MLYSCPVLLIWSEIPNDGMMLNNQIDCLLAEQISLPSELR